MPEFLRAKQFGYKNGRKKRSITDKFCLSTQTSSALRPTLLWNSALTEDLLKEDDYDFISTAQYQSDPAKWRFGQYRQISGAQFLV